MKPKNSGAISKATSWGANVITDEARSLGPSHLLSNHFYRFSCYLRMQSCKWTNYWAVPEAVQLQVTCCNRIGLQTARVRFWGCTPRPCRHEWQQFLPVVSGGLHMQCLLSTRQGEQVWKDQILLNMRNTGGTNTATWMGIGQLQLMVNNLGLLLFFSSLWTSPS